MISKQKIAALVLVILTFYLSPFTLNAQQPTYDVDFTQTREMKVSGKTTVKSGHLVYKGGEQLEMTYSEPAGEYFIIDGQKVKMNLNGKKGEVNADKVKTVGLQRTTLLNCLSGNWEEAAKANTAEASVNEGKGKRTVTLTATGKVPRGGYTSVVLTYRTSDGKLLKMILEEAAGIKNTYEIVL